jgi:hypothetical protein
VYNKVWASLTATSSSQLLRAGVPHVISVLGRTPGFLVGLDDYHNPHFDFSLLFEIGTRMPARVVSWAQVPHKSNGTQRNRHPEFVCLISSGRRPASCGVTVDASAADEQLGT